MIILESNSHLDLLFQTHKTTLDVNMLLQKNITNALPFHNGVTHILRDAYWERNGNVLIELGDYNGVFAS